MTTLAQLIEDRDQDNIKAILDKQDQLIAAIAGLTDLITSEKESFFTKAQFMEKMQIGKTTLNKWIADQKHPIPCYRNGNSVVFLESEVIDWVVKTWIRG